MTVDYKISSTLTVQDNLSPVLEKAIGVAIKLSEQMASLTKTVMKAGRVFETSAASAERFSERSGSALGKFTAEAARAKSAAEGMNKEFARMAAQSMKQVQPFTGAVPERSSVERHVSIFEKEYRTSGVERAMDAAEPSRVSTNRQLAPFGAAYRSPDAEPVRDFTMVPAQPAMRQQREVANIGENMRPAWNEKIEGPRVMRDIGGSSIADEPVRNRAHPGLRPDANTFENGSSYPVAIAAGGGGRVPPGQALPGAYGQPFMRRVRDIGGSSIAGAGGGGAGVPPGIGGPEAEDNPDKVMKTAGMGYVGGKMKGYGDRMFDSMKEPIDKALDLERITAGLRQKGLGDAQIADAMKFVRATEIYGTSIVERARIFNEAQGSFRESGMSGAGALTAAKTMMPALAGYQVAMATLDEKSHAAVEGSFNQLNKVVELMGGLTDPKRAQSIVDSVFKAVQSSGKMISERDISMFTTQGGSAVSTLNDKTIFAGLEPLMGEFGGSALGTGMNTAFRNLSGLMAHPAKMMVGEAIKMGLWDRKQIQFNSQGGIGKILDRDKMANPEIMGLMRTDTIGFVKALMQTYQTHGVTTVEGRERENEILLGRTGAKVYNKMMRQLEVMERSEDAFNASKGTGQTNAGQRDSPMQTIMEAQKRYADLQMELGIVVLPMLIHGLEVLIPLMKSAAHWVREHQTLAKILAVAFAGIAAAMVFGGSVLLMRAGFEGLGVALNLLTRGKGVDLLSGALRAMNPNLGASVTAVSKLGVAAGVAAAAFAGWELGKWIYDNVIGGSKLGDWIGKMEAHVLAAFGNKGAREALDVNERTGPAKPDAAHEIVSWKRNATQWAAAGGGADPRDATWAAAMGEIMAKKLNGAKVVMEGEQVGRLVTDHMGSEASRPSTGTSGFDSRMSVLRPDYGY